MHWLAHTLQDAWEFYGLRHMFLFVCYFVYTIVFLSFNWSENAAVFHAEVCVCVCVTVCVCDCAQVCVTVRKCV